MSSKNSVDVSRENLDGPNNIRLVESKIVRTTLENEQDSVVQKAAALKIG